MRSRWSAEGALTWLAVASMEGAWLTLAYIGLQWATQQPRLPLNVLHFGLAVVCGMLIARTWRNLTQTRFALLMAAAVVVAGVIGTLLSGISFNDIGDFIRVAALTPATWLLGLSLVRGAVRSDPRSGYDTERLFSFGIPALVVFWIIASITSFHRTDGFLAAAFTVTLTFVSAGLLALGLSRLDDLEVEAADRAARRRWLGLLVAIVLLVLVVGVPLALFLGVPVSSAVSGVLGPLAPVLIWIFYLMSIPIFWLLDLLSRAIGNPFARPPASILSALPTPIGNGPPPLFEPGTAQVPELTWLLIAIVAVGLVLLVRVLAALLRRPVLTQRGAAAGEVRAAEAISLPALPHLPRLALRQIRRPAPRSANEAYRLALTALHDGPQARQAAETPREHASRIGDSAVGREMAWLATDYQLGDFATEPLSAKEERRAIERWRRVASKVRRAGHGG